MSVLDKAALEGSPLADLHTIASELSIDGYRRLRKADLIDRIIARQEGREVSEDEPEAAVEDDEPAASKRRRGRRGGRGRGRESGETQAAEPETAEEPAEPAPAVDAADETAEGVVELLGNGSGFIRVSPPEATDQDVYISAAQVKRCELVNGDRVSGPKRPPRRSERFASLVRIDTVNGRPASELSDGARYDDLPAAFPTERFRLASEDATLKAIEFLTPFGRGSRVSIVGAAGSGKSSALRLLAEDLAAQEGLQLFVALSGVRPEEISEWPREGALAPAGALSFAASADALDHGVELVVDQARRIAARGADAVVLIDTLDGLHPHAARKALAAARNIVDGGSLTVIATTSRPVGGETTVIALDSRLTAAGRFPALDLAGSGTIRAELLVGDAGAEAIRGARAEALDAAG
jgi:transcription termination factor Rho